MDKYHGLSKPESRSKPVEYEVIYRGNPSKKKDSQGGAAHKEAKNGADKGGTDWFSGFLFRCFLCLIVVLICAVGKFTSVGVAQQASGFIKDELKRDSVAQAAEFVQDKLAEDE